MFMLQLAYDVYPYSPPALPTSTTQAPIPLIETINKELTRLEPWSSDHWEHDQLQVQWIDPKRLEMTKDTKYGDANEKGHKELKPTSLNWSTTPQDCTKLQLHCTMFRFASFQHEILQQFINTHKVFNAQRTFNIAPGSIHSHCHQFSPCN